jgi:hypothetical protein
VSYLAAAGERDDRAITLVSTYTIDEICGPDGRTQRRTGGPAHYVGAALDLLGFPYNLITGSRPRVQVLSGPHGDQYVIPSIPHITLPEKIEGCAVILSPIIGEIDRDAALSVNGLLAVDVQGFVREPGVPSGEVSRKFDLSRLISRADFVKGGDRELGLLDSHTKKLLGRTTVIETRGSNGAMIHRGGQSHALTVPQVSAPDTIGAGDTFLAAFVVAILRGVDVVSACQTAGTFTSGLLGQRRSQEAATELIASD